MKQSSHRIRTLITLGALCVCLAIFTQGCSKKKDGSGDGSEMSGVSDEDLALQNQKRFGSGNIPMAESGGMFEDVHFDFNSSSVQAEYQSVVQENARKILANPGTSIVLEGHCDRRGTAEYNLALGENRARSVAAMLVSFGVPARQLNTISYGEEIPLQQGDSEEAYAANRRVHFALQGGTSSTR